MSINLQTSHQNIFNPTTKKHLPQDFGYYCFKDYIKIKILMSSISSLIPLKADEWYILLNFREENHMLGSQLLQDSLFSDLFPERTFIHSFILVLPPLCSQRFGLFPKKHLYYLQKSFPLFSKWASLVAQQ